MYGMQFTQSRVFAEKSVLVASAHKRLPLQKHQSLRHHFVMKTGFSLNQICKYPEVCKGGSASSKSRFAIVFPKLCRFKRNEDKDSIDSAGKFQVQRKRRY